MAGLVKKKVWWACRKVRWRDNPHTKLNIAFKKDAVSTVLVSVAFRCGRLIHPLWFREQRQLLAIFSHWVLMGCICTHWLQVFWIIIAMPLVKCRCSDSWLSQSCVRAWKKQSLSKLVLKCACVWLSLAEPGIFAKLSGSEWAWWK